MKIKPLEFDDFGVAETLLGTYHVPGNGKAYRDGAIIGICDTVESGKQICRWNLEYLIASLVTDSFPSGAYVIFHTGEHWSLKTPAWEQPTTFSSFDQAVDYMRDYHERQTGKVV